MMRVKQKQVKTTKNVGFFVVFKKTTKKHIGVLGTSMSPNTMKGLMAFSEKSMCAVLLKYTDPAVLFTFCHKITINLNLFHLSCR